MQLAREQAEKAGLPSTLTAEPGVGISPTLVVAPATSGTPKQSSGLSLFISQPAVPVPAAAVSTQATPVAVPAASTLAVASGTT